MGQSGNGRKDWELIIDKRFPFKLTQDELMDLCGQHHYGGYVSGAADCGDVWKHQAYVWID